MKYILKPVELEAVYYDGYQFKEEPEWVLDAIKNHDLLLDLSYVHGITSAGYTFKIKFQGSYSRKLYPGNYLVKDAYGRLIPCNTEEFNIFFKKKDS